MIYQELKTALPIYDSVEKQNRYRSHCAAVCDFKLLTPVGKILPFQFMIEKTESTAVNNWYIKCAADDSTYFDLSGGVGYISVKTSLAVGDFISYNGVDIPGLYLECGTYYFELVITTGTTEVSYFSEVFTVIEGLENVSHVQSDFPLFTPWRWYDDEDKLTTNQRHCQAVCDFTLICGQDVLLPFMFRKPTGANSITSWILQSSDCSVTLDHTLIQTQTIGGYDYIYFKAEDAFGTAVPCGTYTSILTIDGEQYFSEPIKVIGDLETLDTNYILQENGFIILAENTNKLIQE